MEVIDNDKDKQQRWNELHRVDDYLDKLQIKGMYLSWYRRVSRFYAELCRQNVFRSQRHKMVSLGFFCVKGVMFMIQNERMYKNGSDRQVTRNNNNCKRKRKKRNERNKRDSGRYGGSQGPL